jgi:hypothetical protein
MKTPFSVSRAFFPANAASRKSNSPKNRTGPNGHSDHEHGELRLNDAASGSKSVLSNP